MKIQCCTTTINQNQCCEDPKKESVSKETNSVLCKYWKICIYELEDETTLPCGFLEGIV